MRTIYRYTPEQDIESSLISLCANWDFWDLNSIKESLANPAYMLFYTLLQTHISGFLLTHSAGEELDIIYLYVAVEARNQGLGLELLNTLEQYARSHTETKRIYFEVRKSNLEAIRLYERFGAFLTAERKNYYKNGEDAYVFTKVTL